MLNREAIKKFGSTAANPVTDSGPSNTAIAVFPRELREERKNWPCVSFSAENQFVFLPIPPGLAFSDNISYNTINLGILGPTAVNAIQELTNTVSGGQSAGQALRNVVGGIKDRIQSGNAAAAASIMNKILPVVGGSVAGGLAGAAVGALGSEAMGGIINYANRQVLSPNTNTTFESPGIRSFNFSFKLVARDKGDTEAIKSIVSFFRKYAYPEGNTVLMKYPPVWTIKFYNGAERNAYIPGIYGCYLTGINTAYNAGTNIFHADGSPVEVDCSLSFQETKVLTRTEIEKLNSGEGEL